MRKKFAIVLLLVFMVGLVGCANAPTSLAESDKDIGQNTVPVGIENTIDTAEGTVEEGEGASETIPVETNHVLEDAVYPLPSTIDIDNLGDCTLRGVIENGYISPNDETLSGWQLRVKVCDYERFDAVDVANLDVGKILVIDGHYVEVHEIKRDEHGSVLINGGTDGCGYELVTNEDGMYFSLVYNMKTYYTIGEIVLDLSPEFVYVDESVSESGKVVCKIQDMISDDGTISYFGTPHDTAIVVEDGVVVSLTKSEPKYLNCSCSGA